ncbi:MAG TPA: hypothetical protein VGE12_06340 [Noviherbaspirillum sp.]
MSNDKKPVVDVGKTEPEPVRTKDNPIGIDDIGLPAGIRKDEVARLNEIRPDPDKVDKAKRD